MSINAKLFNSIFPYELVEYDLLWDDAHKFLLTERNFDQRQKLAIEIIHGIMIKHGKKNLLGHITELARVEHGIKELEPWARDHVVHAVLSFILGIYINENLLKSEGIIISDFQWKLAGLFHDIAYPAQFAGDFLKRQTKCVVDIHKELGDNFPKLGFKIVPYGFENLSQGENAFDLIAGQLNCWGLKIDPKSEYNKMIDSGKLCHGMIGALMVLNVVDRMYQAYNPRREYKTIHADYDGADWNQHNFEGEVIPSCSAIFIHNLHSKCFVDAKIDRAKAPLAFLLRLTDNLQDWDRPSEKVPVGNSPDLYDISFEDGKLIFRITDDERRNNIKTDLESSLIMNGIEIV